MTAQRHLAIGLGAILLLAGAGAVAQGLWIQAKAAVAQILLERAFAESRTAGAPVKPWRWADTWPVARLSVPRLNESVIVLHGGSGQALAFGPGLLEATARPGETGAAVIAAHRDTHFAFVGALRKNDMIEVERADGVRVSFRVRRTAVVNWERNGIDPNMPERMLVLATCWPLRSSVAGDLRYLVYAEAVEPALAAR